MHRIHVAALVVALTALVGCSGGSEEKKEAKDAGPVMPKAGQCLAKEVKDGNDTAPDFTSAVPCDEPHAYEVLGTVPVPEKFLAGKTDEEKLERRTELAKTGEKTSRLSRQMKQATYGKCYPKAIESSGLSAITVRGKSAKQLGLDLPITGSTGRWYTLSSPEQWLAGTTSVVCSIRYTKPGASRDAARTLQPVSSPDERPAIEHYLDASFPAGGRTCASGTKLVDCAGDHREESLYDLDVRAAFGTGFLRGDDDLKTISYADFGKIQRVCGQVYSAAGFSQAGTSFGYRFYDATDGDSLRLTCTLRPITGETFTELSAFSD